MLTWKFIWEIRVYTSGTLAQSWGYTVIFGTLFPQAFNGNTPLWSGTYGEAQRKLINIYIRNHNLPGYVLDLAHIFSGDVHAGTGTTYTLFAADGTHLMGQANQMVAAGANTALIGGLNSAPANPQFVEHDTEFQNWVTLLQGNEFLDSNEKDFWLDYFPNLSGTTTQHIYMGRDTSDDGELDYSYVTGGSYWNQLGIGNSQSATRLWFNTAGSAHFGFPSSQTSIYATGETLGLGYNNSYGSGMGLMLYDGGSSPSPGALNIHPGVASNTLLPGYGVGSSQANWGDQGWMNFLFQGEGNFNNAIVFGFNASPTQTLTGFRTGDWSVTNGQATDNGYAWEVTGTGATKLDYGVVVGTGTNYGAMTVTGSGATCTFTLTSGTYVRKWLVTGTYP